MGMMLDYIPLAIAQAAAVINHRKSRMTIARYLKCLQESEKVMLEDMGDLRRDSKMPSSVIKVWCISFHRIKSNHPQSANLLSLMSVLDHQGLRAYLFLKGKRTWTSSSSSDGNTFWMHRLVRITIKSWLDLHGETQK